jgi:wyosine [tRNA(Phe)-imidazoG37] synthetase (radical SAM superfamily)
MQAVYGPVPSRRLGQSLGVDPIPFKTCNYNCIYCQLGRTTPLTSERKDYIPPEEILAQVKEALARHRPGEIDYITFVGQGEPLLCASIGWLIGQIIAITAIPVAVITNGSLLYLSEVRAGIRAADVVMPTLDAADETTFRRINRPWPKLRIAEIIKGMVAFRDEFPGQLWMEVMLVKGVNDTAEVLLGLRDALARIRPDQVHINIPIRPPAEAWVEPPDEEGLMRAVAILGDVARVMLTYEGSFELAEDLPVAEAIVEIIRRHPMQERELLETLARFAPGEVQRALQDLVASGEAQEIVYQGQTFWLYVGGRYAPRAESASTDQKGV